MACTQENSTALRDGALYLDAASAVGARVEDLLARMSLEEKLGQMCQVERGALITASDIQTYFIGSLLSGGGSGPAMNSPVAWADMIDDFQVQALNTPLKIPLLYGVDAVHGHNNVYGAVIFPHNIGLGCTRNPGLVKEAARITAVEMWATGAHWTFAPCIAVPRDERWGRTYEGFGETSELAEMMALAVVSGIQGESLDGRIDRLACAKHFIGDGATAGGDDQGDVLIDEVELRRIHLPGYIAAIDAGVGSVMASYNSWQGEKLHGHSYLINEVLKGELGFDGFVVSDWAAIDQLPGNYADDVAKSINAGIDMVMVPYRYKEFLTILKSHVASKRITQTRIDDAVTRILRIKFRMGLFEQPFSDPGRLSDFGGITHRNVARQCVRESLVLLKNENGVLPIKASSARLIVAGRNGNDLGAQCGGWTISWEGSRGTPTVGSTIFQALRQAAPQGVTVEYTESGAGVKSDDLVVAVLGESPYVEGGGDRSDLSLNAEDLALIERLSQSGARIIGVLVSGRPMIVTEVISKCDAFVAAWLPGTEGGGVADILLGAHSPSGKLNHTWPRAMDQIPINNGEQGLFSYGFGLTY